MKARNYIHAQATSHTEEGKWYTELDQWGRVVFHRDPFSYWAMKFYHKPEPPEWNPTGPPLVDVTAYEVVHKWWHLYHAERSTEVSEPIIINDEYRTQGSSA